MEVELCQLDEDLSLLICMQEPNMLNSQQIQLGLRKPFARYSNKGSGIPFARLLLISNLLLLVPFLTGRKVVEKAKDYCQTKPTPVPVPQPDGSIIYAPGVSFDCEIPLAPSNTAAQAPSDEGSLLSSLGLSPGMSFTVDTSYLYQLGYTEEDLRAWGIL